MKLHHKGFLLQALSQYESAWDYELIQQALAEYDAKGSHWINTFRVALDELAAAGLTLSIEHKLDDGTHAGQGKVLFKYQLTDFGRSRLQETDLLPSG